MPDDVISGVSAEYRAPQRRYRDSSFYAGIREIKMALLLDQSATYASAAEFDAVQNVIASVAQLPVQFMGTQDGVLAIRVEDGVENHAPTAIRSMMADVLTALTQSSDPTVKSVLERSSRIGIV
jgi:hypothetical protein